MTIEARIHQARSEYLSASIAEINDVCNAVENQDEAKVELLRERAQESGKLAQEKFDNFVQAVAERKASQDNEN